MGLLQRTLNVQRNVYTNDPVLHMRNKMCSTTEEECVLKYKLPALGLCLLCWKGRAGRIVLYESFDLWSPSREAANINPAWVGINNVWGVWGHRVGKGSIQHVYIWDWARWWVLEDSQPSTSELSGGQGGGRDKHWVGTCWSCISITKGRNLYRVDVDDCNCRMEYGDLRRKGK